MGDRSSDRRRVNGKLHDSLVVTSHEHHYSQESYPEVPEMSFRDHPRVGP